MKESPKKKRKNKSQKERLKKQLAKERERKARGHSTSPPRREVKERGPKRDSKGRFLTDRSGKPICFAFNNGECKGVCSKNMVHICQTCLGSHPAKECRKGNNN